ncbi:MAG: VOC family protein [Myxococcota bacterium]
MQCLPMLYVDDVRRSSQWYRDLLDASHDHDNGDFDRILKGEAVLLMLHDRHAHEHGHGGASHEAGSGIQLWFVVDNIRDAHARATALNAQGLTQPTHNPNAHWTEFTMVDLDGYAVAIAAFG